MLQRLLPKGRRRNTSRRGSAEKSGGCSTLGSWRGGTDSGESLGGRNSADKSASSKLPVLRECPNNFLQMAHSAARAAQNMIRRELKDVPVDIIGEKENPNVAQHPGFGMMIVAETTTGYTFGADSLGKRGNL